MDFVPYMLGRRGVTQRCSGGEAVLQVDNMIRSTPQRCGHFRYDYKCVSGSAARGRIGVLDSGQANGRLQLSLELHLRVTLGALRLHYHSRREEGTGCMAEGQDAETHA